MIISPGMRFLLLIAAGALCSALVFTRPACAQNASDKAQAEALFQAGRDLMSAGKFAEACPKFEASQRLDAGIGTLLYLADCYEKSGRLASAWATFREAESVAMQHSESGRAQVAKKRAAALEPRLPKLSVMVAQGNPPDTVVKRSGTVVPRESWDLALPVDPGSITIEASAPGRKPWSTTVKIEGEQASNSVDVPVLEEAPMEQKEATTPKVAAAPAQAPVSPGGEPPETTGSGQRTIGLVVGGAGIVGLGLGTFFGLRAKSKNDSSKERCPNDPNICDQQGVNLRDQAKSAATLSTAFMIGGGALLAGGVVLYLTAPKSLRNEKSASALRVTADIGPTVSRVTVGGAF